MIYNTNFEHQITCSNTEKNRHATQSNDTRNHCRYRGWHSSVIV